MRKYFRYFFKYFCGLVLLLILLPILIRVLLAAFPQHRIWYNAHIITLNEQQPVASAIEWRNGVITALGDDDELLEAERWYTRTQDMRGKTLMPGFVDAHSHFPASGIETLTVNLASPPLGSVNTLDQLYQQLQHAAIPSGAGFGSRRRSESDWLIGFNYDHSRLLEGKHPSREALDRISRTRPFYCYHSSGHLGVANTAALKKLGLIPEDYPDGLLLESQAPSLNKLVADFGPRQLWQAFTAARQQYLAAGITTLNSGASNFSLALGLRVASWMGVLPMRVISNQRDGSKLLPAWFNSAYFSTAAVKIIVDGSPQGFTAFFTEPYVDPIVSVDNTEEAYRGEPLMSLDELVERVRQHSQAGHQLALHGNGDAAIDMILEAIELAGLNQDRDHRTLVVHAQTARKDQIERMRMLGAVPTFFTSHVYYWGDWHAERVVGVERAQHLSPTGWAREAGLRFSIHSDSPVTPINPFELMSFAMQRTSLSGQLLGEEHQLSIEQALRAVTIDAAWQHYLADKLGSLEPGKFADFIVLSDDPLQVAAAQLDSIQVLTNVIAGKVAYSREDQP